MRHLTIHFWLPAYRLLSVLLCLMSVSRLAAEQNGFTLFGSDISLNPNFGLLALNKKDADEIANNLREYLQNTAWPTVKNGSRELVAEIAKEIVLQTQQHASLVKAAIQETMTNSFKQLFLAAAGLALVIVGGQIIRDALTTKNKKRSLISRLTNSSIGACLVATGTVAIIWCDRITTLMKS